MKNFLIISMLITAMLTGTMTLAKKGGKGDKGKSKMMKDLNQTQRDCMENTKAKCKIDCEGKMDKDQKKSCKKMCREEKMKSCGITEPNMM